MHTIVVVVKRAASNDSTRTEILRNTSFGRKHIQPLDGSLGSCLYHDLWDGFVRQTVIHSTVSFLDSANSPFNLRDMGLGGHIDHFNVIVIVSHYVFKRLELGIDMDAGNAKSGSIVDTECLVKSIT